MVRLSGNAATDLGVRIEGADVAIFATSVNATETTGTGSAAATTTTDSSGNWAVTGLAENTYDVRIKAGSSFRWFRFADEIQHEGAEFSRLAMRNPANTFVYDMVPAAITANRTLNLPLITGTATLLSSEYLRVIEIFVFDIGTDAATGNGKAWFRVPAALNGMNIVSVHAEVATAGTTNTLDIQLRNATQSADILSTVLTVDSAETGSDTAATPALINTSEDDLQTNDVIFVDIDAVHTTPSKGLIVTIEARLP